MMSPMRIATWTYLLLLTALVASAQTNPSIINTNVDPSGSCGGAGTPKRYNYLLNKLWGCSDVVTPGTFLWTVVASGSSPSVSPGPPDQSYQYDNAGAFAGSDILSRDGTNRRNVMTRAGIEFDYVAAPGAPTVALIAAAGNINAGDHQYMVTWCTAGASCTSAVTAPGETNFGAESLVVTTDAGHGQVTVSRPASPPASATHWKIYRTDADSGSGNEEWIASVVIGSTIFTDNIADPGNALPPPTTNTTAGGIYGDSTVVGRFTNHVRLGNSADSFDTSVSNFPSEAFDVGSYTEVTGSGSSVGVGFWGLGAGIDYTTAPSSASDDATAFRAQLYTSGGNNPVRNLTGIQGSATAEGGDVDTIYGVNAQAGQIQGTVTNVFSVSGAYNGYGGSATNVSLLHAYGAFVGNTLTNLYGLKIDDQTGATNNWAIKTGLGKVEFGDNLQLDGKAFAALGTPANGTQTYCSDCAVTSGMDNTCASGGSGMQAFRNNGAWKCVP